MLYVAGCWIVIQVAATLFPELAENTVAVTYLFAANTLGLPVIIFIAWFYELTPGGLVRVAAFVERRGLDNIAPKNG